MSQIISSSTFNDSLNLSYSSQSYPSSCNTSSKTLQSPERSRKIKKSKKEKNPIQISSQSSYDKIQQFFAGKQQNFDDLLNNINDDYESEDKLIKYNEINKYSLFQKEKSCKSKQKQRNMCEEDAEVEEEYRNEEGTRRCGVIDSLSMQQLILKTPVVSHKYLILPNILIDFDLIKEGNFIQDQFGLRLFRSSACVNYLKRLDMVEMEIGINSDAIRDFSFIIHMLDSMQNQQAHQLSETLKHYDQILNECEKVKKMKQQQYMNSSASKEENNWSFQKSREKAYQIIAYISQTSPTLFKYMNFRILRGSNETSEMFSQIISREYLSFLLGTQNIQQLIQIILRQGILFKKTSVDTFDCIKYSKEHHIYDTYESSADKVSQNYDMNVHSTTINDSSYQAQITYQKIQLSNYQDKYNDYLLVVSQHQQESKCLMDLLMKRLEEQQSFQQPLFSQPNPTYMDISYQAQSEVFIEKFYHSSKQNLHS